MLMFLGFFYETNRKKREEAIFVKVIKQLPPDNNRFYVKQHTKRYM